MPNGHQLMICGVNKNKSLLFTVWKVQINYLKISL